MQKSDFGQNVSYTVFALRRRLACHSLAWLQMVTGLCNDMKMCSTPESDCFQLFHKIISIKKCVIKIIINIIAAMLIQMQSLLQIITASIELHVNI